MNKDCNDARPKPWSIGHSGSWNVNILDANMERVPFYDEDGGDSDNYIHMIECVNEHERLQEENERLSEAVKLFSDEYAKRLELEDENLKLRKLACEKCKLTKMAFGCRIGNTYCAAFKKRGGNNEL
jgi:hypothetical protein